MPTTVKTPKRSSARPEAVKAACARMEQSERTIGRIGESLSAAQKDLSAIGGSIGAGASNLGKDVSKLLRDARRDMTKMSKLVRRDVEHLQKDLSSASGTKPRRAGAASSSRAKTSRAKTSRAKAGSAARAAGGGA